MTGENAQPDDQSQQAMEFFRAMADAERIRIAAALMARPLSAEELAREAGLPITAVVRHLPRLESIGLVQSEQPANGRTYRFDVEALQALKRSVLGGRRRETVVEGGDEWERKILRDFLDGERLKTIPAQAKKRAVILSWLAGQFSIGERYPEPEVNHILSRHHPDFATLRRELVDRGLMRREHGVYWRAPGEA